jgi:signal transduction histidine kinase
MSSYPITWITNSIAVGRAPMSYAEFDYIKAKGVDAIVNLCAEFSDLHELEEPSGFEVYYLPIRDVTDHIQLKEEHRTKERLQGVLEMAGAAAHELNTPIFSALGTAQLVLDDLNDQQLQDNLKTMIKTLIPCQSSQKK